MTSKDETVKTVDRDRLQQIVKLGTDIYRNNPGAHWAIRNQLETIDRLLPNKSLMAFSSGAVRANSEAGLRRAAIRLLELIVDA